MERGKKIRVITLTAFLMFIGVLLFKYFPMAVYGSDIEFDASLHVVLTIFFLFLFWMLISGRRLSAYYLIFSYIVVMVVGFQQMFEGAHDVFGLGLGAIIGLSSIFIPLFVFNESVRREIFYFFQDNFSR